MPERRFALIDADSFYANCHRVFRPDLIRTPIVVLSNNDGCVIARSAEAKLHIEMGDPFHKMRHLLRRHGIVAFSSNYALYGDMSQRVMTVIESLVPSAEVYSIDESFAELTGITTSLERLGKEIRAQVLQCTGIPTGVGIGPTKTIAKLANHSAKRWRAQTGGVVDLSDPERPAKVMKVTKVGKVWGVGKRLQAKLEALGIITAWDLAQADAWSLRKKFSVVLERTARELNGIPCMELEDAAPPRQEICCSRMFGIRLEQLAPIREAVATYTTRAAEKLREQGSVCAQLRVSIRTGMFNPNEAKFANGVGVKLPYPTDDTRLLINAAMRALEAAYRPGFAFSKAEVLLLDLCARNEHTLDLFTEQQPQSSERVMQVLDSINARWGRSTIHPGAVPLDPDWKMKQQFLSPNYTTRLADLPKIPCR